MVDDGRLYHGCTCYYVDLVPHFFDVLADKKWTVNKIQSNHKSYDKNAAQKIL